MWQEGTQERQRELIEIAPGHLILVLITGCFQKSQELFIWLHDETLIMLIINNASPGFGTFHFERLPPKALQPFPLATFQQNLVMLLGQWKRTAVQRLEKQASGETGPELHDHWIGDPENGSLTADCVALNASAIVFEIAIIDGEVGSVIPHIFHRRNQRSHCQYSSRHPGGIIWREYDQRLTT